MKALVLAGGRGKHMEPFSATRPNPMVPVAGQYAIDRTLNLLKEAGVNSVNLVVGHRGDIIREHLSEGHSSGVSIHFVEQGKKKGIGSAILKAKDKFTPGEHFLLVYADTMTTANIFSVTLQSFGLHNESTAAICHTSQGEMYGNVYIGPNAKITKFIEKPKKREGFGNYVFAGVFVLNTGFFDYLKSASGDMEEALKALIKDDALRASIWEEDWLDMDYPWDILTANKAMMETWKSSVIHESVEVRGSTVKGSVTIAEGVEISSGAVLNGPAYIGPGSFIGNNAIIRPFTCIGANCVIGMGVELKNCVLFPKVTVGRLSFVGDSVVGENADLGANTTIINRTIDLKPISVKVNGKKIDSGLTKLGAFIGDGAVIGASNTLGAGTVVEAGRKIDHNLSKLK
ncbi:Glucose-1-phosphate thymidylyltransferase [hydrothermal vent metagenome]|uniref:Glucose-1-phosphate thymidylyltransferase n=1 Tax=hydrothermal vent metagenome TaxID=652676 RepID=A0A3B1C1F2_9ZZZZ